MVLILGAQLSQQISSFCAADRDKDLILLAEVMNEGSYVKRYTKR